MIIRAPGDRVHELLVTGALAHRVTGRNTPDTVVYGATRRELGATFLLGAVTTQPRHEENVGAVSAARSATTAATIGGSLATCTEE